MTWFQNKYRCPCGETWIDEWDSMCDDECPKCYTACTPYESIELGEDIKTEDLFDADPNCKHEIEYKWSGFKCKHCPGWFCL